MPGTRIRDQISLECLASRAEGGDQKLFVKSDHQGITCHEIARIYVVIGGFLAILGQQTPSQPVAHDRCVKGESIRNGFVPLAL